jgi:deoxyribose-phosphate aldolase
MASIMDFTKATLGKLFEAGDGICNYHTPDLMELVAFEAKKYGYRSICTSSNYICEYKKLLEGTNIKVIGMVAYPFGDVSIDGKKKEIEVVIDRGCDAIDVVVNMSYLKSERYDDFKAEVHGLVGFARSLKKDLEIKPLVETVLCTDEQLVVASQTVKDSGADFIKTQTGWYPIGLTLRQLKIIRKTVGPDFGIKACGAITESVQGLAACLEEGANIIGGNGVRIIEDLEFYQDFLRRHK